MSNGLLHTCWHPSYRLPLVLELQLTMAASNLAAISQESIFNPEVVPEAAQDPHYGLRAAFQADLSKTKVNLIIGAYRDDAGKPWILPVVKKV
jgi:aspartate aminotransferase